MEGFHFINGCTARFGGGPSDEIRTNHYALRHSEVDTSHRNCVSAGGEFGVIYDNHVHHCHRPNIGNDAHGVMVLPGTTNTWVLANDIHHNFGNGVQWGHGAEAARPDFVFIAGNTIHQDRETGIASKWSNRSVLSSYTIYGYRPSAPGMEWCADDGSYCNVPTSGSSGQAIVSGADGEPISEWIIHNRIDDVSACLRLESAERANYVGNVCSNIQGVGLRLEKSGNNTQILHNTFYNISLGNERAMIQQDWRDNFVDMVVANNIFHTPASHLAWFEDFAGVVPSMRWDNNIAYNEGDSFTLDWRGIQEISNTAELNSVMGSAPLSFENNTIEDPQLENVAGGEFAPLAGSPAVGGGNDAIEALDAEYRAMFGVTLIPECWSDGDYDVGAVCAD